MTRLLILALVAALPLSACTTDDELTRDEDTTTPASDAASDPPASDPGGSGSTTSEPAAPPEEAETAAEGSGGAEKGGAGKKPGSETAPVAGRSSDAPRPDGAACSTRDDCASRICEGEGCGGDTPGQCMPRARMCTKDLRPYCGCDGRTFSNSGSCPMARFAHRGPCKN